MWTTTGLRPLAEPPILDWEWFLRVHVPSERQYRALFPDDPHQRAKFKNVKASVISRVNTDKASGT